MNAQDFSSLQEAYIEVVEKQQLDELSVNKMNTYINKAEKDRDKLNKKWDQGTATPKERKKVFDREEGEARAEKKIKQKTGKDSFRLNALDKLKSAITKEEVDLYDIILSHLLDEGYADTQQAAEAIMVNMSEDWRESICESLLDTVASGAGSVVGTVQRAAREVPKYVQQKVNNVAGTYEYARQRADANAPSGAKMSVPTKPSTPRSREFSHGGKSGMTNPGPNFGR